MLSRGSLFLGILKFQQEFQRQVPVGTITNLCKNSCQMNCYYVITDIAILKIGRLFSKFLFSTSTVSFTSIRS